MNQKLNVQRKKTDPSLVDSNIIWDKAEEEVKMEYVLEVTHWDGNETQTGKITSVVYPENNQNFEKTTEERTWMG